jgi:hypothetical protein
MLTNEQVQKKKLAKTIDRMRFREGARHDITRSANSSDLPRAGPNSPPRAAAAFMVRCPSGLPNCLTTVFPPCNGFCLPKLLTNMQDVQSYFENGQISIEKCLCDCLRASLQPSKQNAIASGLLRSASLPLHRAAIAQLSYATSWLIAAVKTARIWTQTNPRRPKKLQRTSP